MLFKRVGRCLLLLTVVVALVSTDDHLPAVTAGEQKADALGDVARLFLEDVRERRGTRIAKPRVVIRQVPRPPQPGGGVLVLADRRMIQRLKKARQLLAKEKFTDAATLLQIILDAQEDSFFHPDSAKKTLYRSLKAEAQQLIGKMPVAGLQAYEFQHGATARAMLTEALMGGNIDEVAEVSRRFFATAAGHEAMYHVGTVHFDRGRPLAAALCFNQLLRTPRDAAKWEPALSLRTALCWTRAGLPIKAEDVLKSLRAKFAYDTIHIGDEDVKLFPQGDDGSAWLAKLFGRQESTTRPGETDWTMFRGNAARNGIVAEGNDDSFGKWKSPVATVYDVTRVPTDLAETESGKLLKKAVRDVKGRLQQQKRIAFPRAQPLVVNGTLYVRTIGSVLALDPRDGSRRWETYCDGTIERLLGGSDNAVPGPGRSLMLQMLVSQRIWGDATYGRMSSDGEFLYSIEQLGLSPAVFLQRGKLVPPSRHNTLVAYQFSAAGRVGHRAWTLGGAKGDPLFENPLAGTFFLGAPLPLGGQLYCLAEVGGEIRLLVLDPHRPSQPIWSQPLVGASLPIHQDVWRRLAGTTVSYADGIMVCPTGAGYVIAVDLTHRSLLWGYRPQPSNAQPQHPARIPQPVRRRTWLDSTATIVDGKVLLTPRSSNDICCLNLSDGSLAWQKTKKDGLYLVGVVDGKVLLVGSSTVQALSLKDGSAAWKKAAALATPSGWGFIRDGRFYLPLTTAQIAVVDIATGNIVSTTKTPEGLVPGNLLAVGGTIISQGIDRVDVFSLTDMGAQKVVLESRRQ